MKGGNNLSLFLVFPSQHLACRVLLHAGVVSALSRKKETSVLENETANQSSNRRLNEVIRFRGPVALFFAHFEPIFREIYTVSLPFFKPE